MREFNMGNRVWLQLLGLRQLSHARDIFQLDWCAISQHYGQLQLIYILHRWLVECVFLLKVALSFNHVYQMLTFANPIQ